MNRELREGTDMVRALIAESGLTVGQIARAMGVSPRTIRMWAVGTAVAPAAAAQRLLALQELILSLAELSAEGRRSALLDSSSGQSLYARFSASAPRHEQIHFPLPVAERLGL